jgi:hypothetical protein
MNVDAMAARLREYAPADALEQEAALREMLQCIVLAALSRAGFFAEALFHGGTCLRLVHDLPRFSEDLDFLLKRTDPGFGWKRYLEAVRRDCALQGIRFEATDKSAAASAVRKAWLKTDSVGAVLQFLGPFPRAKGLKIRIKLEVDSRPPEGSGFETHYLRFPAPLPMTVQDLPSAFATKAHALLCRSYTKGRDWYDFIWFVSRRVIPRLDVLSRALDQQGPWAGRSPVVDAPWFAGKMRAVVGRTDWPRAVEDVRRFLPLREQESLAHWNAGFFDYHVDRMEAYMAGRRHGSSMISPRLTGAAEHGLTGP